jgi:hypothetical protein
MEPSLEERLDYFTDVFIRLGGSASWGTSKNVFKIVDNQLLCNKQKVEKDVLMRDMVDYYSTYVNDVDLVYIIKWVELLPCN